MFLDDMLAAAEEKIKLKAQDSLLWLKRFVIDTNFRFSHF